MTVKTAARVAQEAIWQDLIEQADKIGKAFAEDTVPTPMIVQEINPLTGAVKRTYPPVMDGVCGFAWIEIRPGTSSFARWLKANDIADRAYGGGLWIWVSDYNQSMTLKEAYARGFASVLQDAGINAYAASRMD